MSRRGSSEKDEQTIDFDGAVVSNCRGTVGYGLAMDLAMDLEPLASGLGYGGESGYGLGSVGEWWY